MLFRSEHGLCLQLRRLFFQNVMYNPHAGVLPEQLAIYIASLIEAEAWDAADCLTDVLIAVNNRFQWQDPSLATKDPQFFQDLFFFMPCMRKIVFELPNVDVMK